MPLQLILPRPPDAPTSTAAVLGLLTAFWAVLIAYLAAFDGGPRGATPGKRIVRTRVVDQDTGGPIGYRRALVRRIVYLVGGIAFYIDWVWLLFDRRKQALHDKAARSLVVKAAAARATHGGGP